MKYIPPTKFCVFPSMGYWEVDGKPVSWEDAKNNPNRIWKQSEIAKNIKDYVGYFEEDDE